MLPLFPGFNTLIVRPTDGQEPLDDPTYHVVLRRVLSLNGLATCDADCQALMANPYAENGTLRYIVGDGISRSILLTNHVPAAQAGIRADVPVRMAHGPDGSLYFAHTGGTGAGLPPGPVPQVVRRVDPIGIITTMVGGGTNAAVNTPALGFLLRQQPLGWSVAPDGSLCLAVAANATAPHRVWRVGTDGILRNFVGGGWLSELTAGVSVAAINLNLNPPGGGTLGGIAHDGAGNLYLSHRMWRSYSSTFHPGGVASNLVGVISRVTPDGQLISVVGGGILSLGGLRNFEWEGERALNAFVQPQALAVSPEGRIFFYDGSGVIVRADPDEQGYLRSQEPHRLRNRIQPATGRGRWCSRPRDLDGGQPGSGPYTGRIGTPGEDRATV